MTLKNTYIYFLLFVLVFRINDVLACDFTTSQPVVIIPSGTHNATAGFTQLYILTNNLGVIVATSTNGNFGLQNFGSYNAFAFNYDNSNPPVLPVVGANISTVVGGCFSLTSPLVVTVCNTSIDSVCEGSGNPILIAMNPNYNNALGFNQYIVVVNASGNIVSIKPLNVTSGSVSYTTTSVTGELTFGNYTVYTVNYNNPSTLGSLGLTVGNAWPSNFGAACASASSGDLIQVTHCCGTITYDLDSVNLSCFNNLSGQINFSNANGGAIPYSYSINNGLSFQPGTTFNGLNAGLYTVVVKDNSNCTDTNQIQVNQPAVLTATYDVDSVKCFGDNSGQIAVIPSGGTAPYVYSWTSSLSTDSLETGLLAGNVTVTLTDLKGCSINSTLTVYQPTQLSFVTAIINTTCGTNNGKITFTAFGGTAPYQYSINNGITFQSLDSFPNILAGIYNVIVKDASNCSVNGIKTITNSGSPIIDSLVITAPLCFGDLGSIKVFASGGSGVLNYNINAGAYQLGTTFLNLSPNATYTYGVKDAMGCTSSKDTIMLSPTQIAVVSIDSSTISCFGLNDGFITLNVSGGTGAYQYSINGGSLQASNNFSNLVAANYSIHVVDANGCSIDTLIVLPEPTQLSIPRTITNVSCFGLNNGIINITPTGGTLPITQLWQTSGNSGLQESNLGAGSFMVTITDAHNCTLDSTFVITQPIDFNVTLAIVDTISCHGLFNGSINTTVSDLIGTYSFQWNALANNQTSALASNLGVGSYSVVTTNNLTGCKDSSSLVLNEPSKIVINLMDSSNITCFGLNDGFITPTISGGTGLYQYSMNGSALQASNSFLNLNPNSYTIHVQDVNNCFVDSVIIITEPLPLSIPRTITNVSCFGLSNGIININPAGGTLPISQLWQTSGNIGLQENNLGAGTYTVSIADGNNCTLDSTFTITEPLDFNVSATIVDSVSCNGLTDASAMASVSDLTGTYSFLWNALANNQTTATAINLGVGNYTVFATNVLTGCKDTAQIILINPSAITISTEPNPTICIGQNTIISVNGSGGTGSLVYNWDNGLPQGLSQTVSPITTTIYHVIATDNHGCGSNALTITVNVKAALSVQVLKDDTICLGSRVTILSIPTGGDGNYIYNWSNGNTTSQFNAAPTSITNYILTLSDGCGSTPVTDNAVITVMPPPNANFNQTNYTGCFPVNAVYHAGTINPNYQYQWYSGSNLLSTTDSLNYNFNTIGCTDIKLVVTEQINASLSCNFSHTFPNAVCVSDYPKADFTYDSTDLNIFNPFVDFSNLSSNADMYSWTVDGVVFSSADNPSYNFGSDSVKSYTVCLVATNSAGCPNQYCNEVNVKDVDLFYIPNTFTPDGDHDNDIFKPVLAGFDLSTFKFQIFDRWGELIFYSENIDFGWDGLYKNKLCQQDVYVWKISAQTIARKENKQYLGHVNLIK